jgi:hypothetical protein
VTDQGDSNDQQKGEEMVACLLIGGMRTHICLEEKKEEEVIEKEEGLGIDGMRRGHKLRRIELPTLLDIIDKQDKMNISVLMI